MRHRLVKLLVAALLVFMLTPLLAVVALDAGYLHPLLLRFFAWQNDRTVHAGDLQLSLLRHNPRLELKDVTIGNPPWSSPGTLGHIGRLELIFRPLLSFDHTLLSLRVQDADLTLERSADGHANWQRTNPDLGPGAPLPFLNSLNIEGTHLKLDDERLHLRFDGRLEVASKGADKLHLEARGKLNEHPIEFALEADPLAAAKPGQPYHFQVTERSSGSQFTADGTLPRPFDLDRLDTRFSARGADLRDLYYLVGVSLPNTAAYQVSGTFTRAGGSTRFTALSGSSGESDVEGALSLDTEQNGRTLLSGALKSRRLRMGDLGAKAAGRDPNPSAPPKLFSDVPIVSDAMVRVDSNVRIDIARLLFTRLELDDLTADLRIDRGQLKVPHFAARLWDGGLTGELGGDANAAPPTETVAFDLKGGRLDEFKRADGSAPWGGTLDARIQLSGHGRSVHELMASASGTASAVIPKGTLREAFAELAGVDLRGLGLALSRNQREVNVRCAAARFEVRDGVMKVLTLTVDSDDVLISGTGTVALGSEAYNLSLKGEPKSVRILKMRTPVKVGGTLLEPKFSIEKNLGTLKLVDTGKAQDADCASLEAEAR